MAWGRPRQRELRALHGGGWVSADLYSTSSQGGVWEALVRRAEGTVVGGMVHASSRPGEGSTCSPARTPG